MRGDNQRLPSDAFVGLLREHALPGLDRQLWLDRLAGDADWWIEQASGRLTLGDTLAVPIQFAGSETDRPRTWRWSWANPSVDEPLTRAVQGLRERGEGEAVPEFSMAEFPLHGQMSGHAVCLVACGAGGFDAYYRAPYPGGAAFVMLTLPEQQREPDTDPFDRAVAVLSTAPFALPFPVGAGEVRRFLTSLELEVHESASGVKAVQGNRSLDVPFDNVGRMAGVRTE